MLLPATLGVTALWGLILLDRIEWLPWLELVVAAGITVAVAGLLVGRIRISRGGESLARASMALGLAAILLGPAAWASTPVLRENRPAEPAAGPPTDQGTVPVTEHGAPGSLPRPSGVDVQALTVPGGSLRNSVRARVLPHLIDFLREHRGNARFLAATNGGLNAASIILASAGEPALTIGGFSGADPAPTLEQFQALIASGQVRFVLLAEGGIVRIDDAIERWVQSRGSQVDLANLTGLDVAASGYTLYDLAPIDGAARE